MASDQVSLKQGDIVNIIAGLHRGKRGVIQKIDGEDIWVLKKMSSFSPLLGPFKSSELKKSVA